MDIHCTVISGKDRLMMEERSEDGVVFQMLTAAASPGVQGFRVRQLTLKKFVMINLLIAQIRMGPSECVHRYRHCMALSNCSLWCAEFFSKGCVLKAFLAQTAFVGSVEIKHPFCRSWYEQVRIILAKRRWHWLQTEDRG